MKFEPGSWPRDDYFLTFKLNPNASPLWANRQRKILQYEIILTNKQIFFKRLPFAYFVDDLCSICVNATASLWSNDYKFIYGRGNFDIDDVSVMINGVIQKEAIIPLSKEHLEDEDLTWFVPTIALLDFDKDGNYTVSEESLVLSDYRAIIYNDRALAPRINLEDGTILPRTSPEKAILAYDQFYPIINLSVNLFEADVDVVMYKTEYSILIVRMTSLEPFVIDITSNNIKSIPIDVVNNDDLTRFVIDFYCYPGRGVTWRLQRNTFNRFTAITIEP